MRGKKKNSNGITLIALVITIIVLLILAAVSIATLTGENGILTQAENAKTETAKAAAKEEVQLAVLGSYGNDGNLDYTELKNNLNAIEGITGVPNPIIISSFPLVVTVDEQEIIITGKGIVGEKITIKEVIAEENPFDRNTPVVDQYGNVIVIPEGFKIASDSATDVTGGVVIEDVNYGTTAGSQFVWIPVGTVYTNVEKTASETIILGRYTFDSTTGEASLYSGSYTENTKTETGLSSYGNAIAKDIDAFKLSVERNGGYYIGRYEARVENETLDISTMLNAYTAPNSNWTGYTEGQLVVKPNIQVFNYITQNKASELSRNMYNSKKFTSDLMNSYAWDTAIVFLQTFDDRTDTTIPYSRRNSLNTGSVANQGTNNLTTQDKICNIWDMASNLYEWTTETFESSSYPCVLRGGGYNESNRYTSNRPYGSTTRADNSNSFRPILYL